MIIKLIGLLLSVAAFICLNISQLEAAEANYSKIDPAELPILLHAELTTLRIGADDNVKEVQGVIKRVSIGSTAIELVSDQFVKEGNDVFVSTKKYGKIKVTMNSNAQATFWLTPQQKKELLKLRK